METRLVKDRDKLIWDKGGFSECWEFPRVGFSGGLLLAWMPKQCLIIKYESKHLVHIDLLDNKGQAPYWEGKTLSADLESLKKRGICFSFRWIPAFVLVNVHNMAIMASSAPMHYQWPQHLTL
nr:hypothetical protein CFP56_72464 [Quercus suber]